MQVPYPAQPAAPGHAGHVIGLQGGQHDEKGMDMSTRTERDSLGPVEVDNASEWGAQTQRALLNFNISTERDRKSVV